MQKNVFITGGATGIGADSVAKFKKEGWNISFYVGKPNSFGYGLTKGALG